MSNMAVFCSSDFYSSHCSVMKEWNTNTEPITAELKPTTYLKKQADLDLQWPRAGTGFCQRFGPVLCI